MAWGVSKCRSAIVIQCGEECNMDCTPTFENMMSQILERGHPRVVLDLSEVDYMDSKFLGALSGALKSTRAAGGDLQIANPRNHIWTLFETIRYDTLFARYETIEDAAMSFDSRPEQLDSEPVQESSSAQENEHQEQKWGSGDVQLNPEDQEGDSE